MQKQYTVKYVGARNLPSGGLDYRFPKIGKVFAGDPPKIIYLTDDRYAEARKLLGLEIKPGPAESAEEINKRFRSRFEEIPGAAKLSGSDQEAHGKLLWNAQDAIDKISKNEAKTTARLQNLVISLASGNRLWNAQDVLIKIRGAAEAKRLETLAGFASEIKKAAVRTETVAARPAVEAQVAPELPAEPKTKPKKRGST